MEKQLKQAVLGAGCFWCTEAVYQEIKGILDIQVGFTGGDLPNPSYHDVIYKDTGHIEVAKISFDPTIISYGEILDIFWTMHDPTSWDRQGADVGVQYRSAIFYLNDKQRKIAQSSMERAQKNLFNRDIVTEIRPLLEFYPAEESHEKYYSNNPDAGYCRVVINPKVNKLRKNFQNYIRD